MSALSISFSAIPSDSINDLPIQIHIIQSMPEDVVECPVMERKKIKHEFKEKLFSLVREKRAFKIKSKADLLDLDKRINTVKRSLNRELKRSLKRKNKMQELEREQDNKMFELNYEYEKKMLEHVLEERREIICEHENKILKLDLEHERKLYIIRRDKKLWNLNFDIRKCIRDREWKLLELRRKLLELRRRHTF
jgi:hypothetical protein